MRFNVCSVTMVVVVATLAILVAVCGPVDAAHTWALSLGSFCASRRGDKCCRGRQDDCSTPLLDTLCYCDEFCQRPDSDDCCPDYYPYCLQQNVPIPFVQGCRHNNHILAPNATIQLNCNTCTCRLVNPTKTELMCEERPCLVRPEIVQRVNEGDFGWMAGNYSFFWGKSLDDGYVQRVGVCKPETPVLDQTSVNIPKLSLIEEEFDSRKKWPGLIQGIRDQGEFPSSWAISSVDVAADRLAIQTMGAEKVTMSAQVILDCVAKRKKHCSTSSTDRAWWYLGTFGTVTEECYPYDAIDGTGQCKTVRDTKKAFVKACAAGPGGSAVYRTPPAYRVASSEDSIMAEIRANGPVQALLRVKDDFFVYKSGVYRYTHPHPAPGHRHPHHYHAVRIIGWGTDRSQQTPVKYWLCANSWGTRWGENGYFRIARGIGECDIEMFVVGVWARKSQPAVEAELQLHNNVIV